jgi:very-short-patch-repair endonuclease
MIPYDKIRSHYEYLTPLIMERSQIHPRNWINPYCEIDWVKISSPIENMAWQVIRGFGQAPFYPQYPVDKFFVDFGNPFLKIALECDGREFHLDKEKDNKRDERLFKLGWTVYRIPGKDCVRPVSDEYYDLELCYMEDRAAILCEYYGGTIEGLVKALGVAYFRYKNYFSDDLCNELDIVKDCLEQRLSPRQLELGDQIIRENNYGLRMLI